MTTKPRPIFASATARGGSTLLTLLLNVHPRVSLGKDPFLPLFRSLRNAVLSRAGVDGFDPAAPLDDYYNGRRGALDAIMAADLDLAVPDGELDALRHAQAARMAITEPAFVPHLGMLTGRTYRDLFEAALQMVAVVRPKPDVHWLGFEENWPYEFFPALARTFPDARFVLILRDVRASIASQGQLEDRRLVALPLSFARSWRKLVALAEHYRRWSLFAGRLHVLRYEDLVRDPAAHVGALCRFLDIDFIPEMVAGDAFQSTRGGKWANNSSFAAGGSGIFTHSIDRWRDVLPSDARDLIHLVAAPDLRLAGYDADEAAPADGWARAFLRLDADVANCRGWRTDHRNPSVDFGLELVRRGWLQHEAPSERAIEDAFLFREAYNALRETSRSVTYG